MNNAFICEMRHNIDSLILRNAFHGRAVILFGHCNATEYMVDYLLDRQIRALAILDNNEAKLGFQYRTVPVKHPAFIRGYTDLNSIILIGTRFYEQMAAQLRRFGYNGEILKIISYNSFSEYSLNEHSFDRKKERVLQGIKTLNDIQEQYTASHLVICPNNALGDVYWAMAFLPEYCRKNKIQETVIAVTGNSCRQVAELFGHYNILSFDSITMDELVQAVIFTGHNNCIIAHHDQPYTDNIILYLNNNFLSFVDYYKYAVYGLDRNAKPVKPTTCAPFENPVQIVKNKTVILSPYAKSVVQLSDSFWEEMAGEYHKKGYFVCTNVAETETPIRGTAPIYFPISQAIAAVEYGGCFIGLRSGLCDIVYTANCRKVVVFPNCFYSMTPHKVEDFFALPGWETIMPTC